MNKANVIELKEKQREVDYWKTKCEELTVKCAGLETQAQYLKERLMYYIKGEE